MVTEPPTNALDDDDEENRKMVRRCPSRSGYGGL